MPPRLPPCASRPASRPPARPPARPQWVEAHCNTAGTVVILAQGTHWALAAKQAICIFPCHKPAKSIHSILTTIFSVSFQNWLQRVAQHQLRPKTLCCWSLEGTSQIVLCWQSDSCGVRTHALTDWRRSQRLRPLGQTALDANLTWVQDCFPHACNL